MTPRESAIQGQNHFVSLIYQQTGRGYQYSTATQLAINHIDTKLKSDPNNDFLKAVKQELEKMQP